MIELRAARIIIEGHVQNVGYRAFVAREAGRLHLHGFVRNRHDGSVETFVEGPAPAVEEFLAAAAISSRRIEPAGGEAIAEFQALANEHGADGFFSAPAV